MQQRIILGFVIVLFILFLATGSAAANYMSVYSNGSINPGEKINVMGYVYNATKGGVANATLVVNFTTYNGTKKSSDIGAINFNFSAPTAPGEYNISVTMNGFTKYIPIFISNVSSGTITYINPKPPFSAGTKFTVNITLLDSNGDAVTNYAPEIRIYEANGPKVSWTVTNLTSSSVHSGTITYNVTIPSIADGNYIISVERGMIISVFSIRSGYIAAVSTQTSAAETKSDFYPGQTMTIVAKIRDISGNPKNASSVTARITKPDGTVDEINLALTSTSGQYNGSYSTNASSTGSYDIKIEANVSGTAIESFVSAKTEQVKVRVETQKDFFMEWGDSAAFPVGGDAGLNIIAVNLSDGSTIQGRMNGGASAVNCSNIIINSVTNAINGNAVDLGTITNTTGMKMMTPVCRIQFTAPDTSGFYKIDLNVTVGVAGSTINANGIGYFSAQKYMLKPEAVSSLGGEMKFMTMLRPGDNATFEVTAYNLSETGSDVNSTYIRNISVTKITPLEFMSGSSDITNVIYSVTYPTGSGSNPVVSVVIPENRTGPFLIKMQANISGEIVEGETFYIAKYIMGWLMSEGGMGGDEMGGFGGSSSCEGSEIFSGNVFEIKGMQTAAQGVEFTGILEARNEMIGSAITSCLSMSSNTSDSSGNIRVNVTFSPSCSYSGFYFMLFNVTYQGKTDAVPSGFECRRYNFWAESDNWRKSPTSSANFTFTNIRRMNDSTVMRNGSITLTRVMNWNEDFGGKILIPSSTITVNLSNGTAVLYVSPQNFSNTVDNKWPNGFVDMTFEYCDVDNNCGTSWGGFMVAAFDVWIENDMWGSTYGIGSNVSLTVAVAANVSRDSGNYSDETTTTGFTAKVGKPWGGGKLQTATIINAVLMEDGWNNTVDGERWGRERWNVTVALPSNMKKGESMLKITVNGSTTANNVSETASADMWFNVARYIVKLATRETLQLNDGMVLVNGSWQNIMASQGWDMTTLDLNYSVNPKTGTEICIANALNTDREGVSQIRAGVKAIVLQSVTANNWTLVVNDTNNGNAITVLRDRGNLSDLYVQKIESCNYVDMFNSSYSPQYYSWWGGSYPKNTYAVLPYIIKSASDNRLMANVNVSVGGVIKQKDVGGTMGMGFEQKLTEGSDYYAISSLTDENGVGFVRVNITSAGKYNIFWKMTVGDVSERATFSTGSFIEIRSFSTSGQFVEPVGILPNAVVTMRKQAVSGGVINGYSTSSSTVYNGSYTETSSNDFANSDSVETFYFIWDDSNNNTLISNSTNFTGVSQAPLNESTIIYDNTGETFKVSAIRAVNENITRLAFYKNDKTYGYKWTNNKNSTATVVICANDFVFNGGTGLEGATFYVYSVKWDHTGQTTTNMTMYDPVNQSIITNGIIGPAGCTAINIKHPTGWSNGWNDLKAKVTYGSDTEDVWIGGLDYKTD
jgi:hypothetical protein